MATIAVPEVSAQQRERTFYFRMALAFLAAAVAGFGFFFAIGASSFASPWWVHTHALTMTGFLGLYVVQTWLVHRGDLATHRRLGVIGAVGSVWLVAFSCWAITRTIALGRIAPFFTPNFFLAMDWLNMAVFAGLAWPALLLRNRSDWHKRLMFGAMLSLMSVAWGRLILPLVFDLATRGRIHPAYLVGGGAIVFLEGAAIKLLAGFPPFAALAERIAG